MNRSIAAIAIFMPAIALADEAPPPNRAAMVEAAPAARKTKAEKEADALAAVRDLAHNKEWLAEIAQAAASGGRQKRPKLPPGVAITLFRELRDDAPGKNPFADVLSGESGSPGPTMKPVACERAEARKFLVRAIMWVDTRKYDAEAIKRRD